MKSLSDRIEQYIKALIERSEDQEVEIQRTELAETFNCVPSQITYVLGTRFTLEEGFVTESKRGGKGFVRIKRLTVQGEENMGRLTQSQAYQVIDRMVADQKLTTREGLLLKSLLDREVLDVGVQDRDRIRAKAIKAVIKLVEGKEYVL
jgi:transcriptional regulator CtsR